jgi:hypothetical protein
MLEILVFTIIIFAYCFVKAFNSAIKKSKFQPTTFKPLKTLDERPEVKGEENLSFITGSEFNILDFLKGRESLNVNYYPYNDGEAFYWSHYDEDTNEHVLVSNENTDMYARVINLTDLPYKQIKD